MRIGELCYTTDTGNPKVIKNGDMVFGENQIHITLWSTKTDQERKGVKKWITEVKGPVCPLKMVQRLKATKLQCLRPNEPFFALESGKAVSKAMLVKFLQAQITRIFPGSNPKEWTGISLRKGGATSAIRAGVAGEVVQKLGNWKSAVYKGYIDCSIVDIAEAQGRMATMYTT